MGFHCCLALFIGEVSNPFNIMRKNYALEGKKEQALTISYIFCVIFLVFRVILCPFFIKDTQYSPDRWDPLSFKILAGCMWFISLLWAFMILNLSSKQLAEVSLKSCSLRLTLTR